MLEKALFDELHKRIKHRFKLAGRPYSKREHGEYFKMILKEIVDKLLDECLDSVEKQRGWWCKSCKDFVPVEEVIRDFRMSDVYYHYDCGGECKTRKPEGGK